MKKFFEEPAVEVNKFSVEDVITTSNNFTDPDENAGEGDQL